MHGYDKTFLTEIVEEELWWGGGEGVFISYDNSEREFFRKSVPRGNYTGNVAANRLLVF